MSKVPINYVQSLNVAHNEAKGLTYALTNERILF